MPTSQSATDLLCNPLKIFISEICLIFNPLYELICYTVMSNHGHLVMDLELQVDSDLWTENVLTNEEIIINSTKS